MIIYSEYKKKYMEQVEAGTIGDDVYVKYQKRIGKVGKPQQQAWHNSLKFMYEVLRTSTVPDEAYVSIEYKIPYRNTKMDFIVSGKDDNDVEHAVIVELKQWSAATPVEGTDLVNTFVGGSYKDETHPCYQAWSYAATLENYNEVVQDDNIQLHPCAYMHNYISVGDDPIVDAERFPIIKEAPLFIQNDMSKLTAFISKYVSKNDDGNILYRIDGGKVRPSKSLQDALTSMLKGNNEFILLDQQHEVREKIMYAVNKLSFDNPDKTVFVVKGGPGTGKSVLAIQLLSEILNDGKNACYVTKNSAPRQVYFHKLCKDYKKGYVYNLFKGSGAFVDAGNNDFDVILVDEAHRLNHKSGMFHNQGENQMKEIIKAAHLSVFFIDEEQIVTSYDVGSVKEIKALAKEAKAKYIELELINQFRCGGSDGYLDWVNDVLNIEHKAYDFNPEDYDVQIFDDPEAMRRAIIEKNKENNKARLVAGYCWNWISKKDLQGDDIVIGDFKAQWNFSNTTTWAIDANSVNQIGCIHTSQGLEFDYVGVIIGDDLRCYNGKLYTFYDSRAKTDKSLFGLVGKCKKRDSSALAFTDKIIKNTYRTLMTRGMRGCYIYCTNKELANYLKYKLAECRRRLLSTRPYPTVHKVLMAAEEQSPYGK